MMVLALLVLGYPLAFFYFLSSLRLFLPTGRLFGGRGYLNIINLLFLKSSCFVCLLFYVVSLMFVLCFDTNNRMEESKSSFACVY